MILRNMLKDVVILTRLSSSGFVCGPLYYRDFAIFRYGYATPFYDHDVSRMVRLGSFCPELEIKVVFFSLFTRVY